MPRKPTSPRSVRKPVRRSSTAAAAPAKTVPAKTAATRLAEVIRDALQAVDDLTGGRYRLQGEAAVQLLLGTALHESGGLRWRRQLGGGPARGLFQMEQATYDDIWRNYLAFRRPLAEAIAQAFTPAGGTLSFDQITDDDAYAAIMARLKYLRVPAPLPRAGDLAGQAAYWKKYYNTAWGKGTVAAYVAAWEAAGWSGPAVRTSPA